MLSYAAEADGGVGADEGFLIQLQACKVPEYLRVNDPGAELQEEVRRRDVS
jgi:hypothetical protein